MTPVTTISTPYLELILTTDRSEVSRARRAIGRCLNDLGHAEVVDDACLIVSELVTNAIQVTKERLNHLPREYATAGRVRFRVWENDGHPTVEVWDAFPDDVPQVKHPDFTAEHGRGLHIVTTCSKKWGYVCRTDDQQQRWKSVWAVLK